MAAGASAPGSLPVEKQLERILAARAFAESDRLRELLTYLVRAAVDGRASGLKEIVIAQEVFGRDSYDPKTNSLIRVTVANLRTKLNEYYAGPGAGDPIRISVPKGSYVPVITPQAAAPAGLMVRYRWALAAGLVAALLLGGWLWTRRRASAPGALSSIAVLPFLDLTDDHGMAYFCDGLTEELIDSLAKFKGLAVVARTSSFEFKNKQYDVRSMGQKLGVDSVIEGSVRRSADRLRVTVQLNSTRTGLHLWSQIYEIRLAELFATQDQIVAAVMRAMGQLGSTAPRKRENLDLYQDYLRVKALRYAMGANAEEQAQQTLRRIVAADPDFASAHAELASSIFNWGLNGRLTPAETASGVRLHVAAALRADPGNSEAHLVLCRLLTTVGWDWAAAERECREAIRLSPGAAQPYIELGVLLSTLGRPDGVAALEHAVKLDPLSRRAHSLLAQALYFTRRYQESIRAANRAAELDPGYPSSYIRLALSNLALKNYAAALESANRGASLNKSRENVDWLGLLASIHASSGQRERALDLLKQIEAAARQQRVSLMIFARVYACLGEPDKMFEHLEHGYAEHDPLMPWLAVDARFDPYRNDPRFKDLLRRMKLG